MSCGNNGFLGGFGNNSCIWIILIIIVLCCCCGNGFGGREDPCD